MVISRISLKQAALSLVLLSALSIAACGGSSASTSTAKTAATSTTSTSASTGSSTGTGSASTSSSSSSSSTVTLDSIYISSDDTFSVKYPAGWTISPLTVDGAPGAVSIISTSSNDLFVISPLNVQVPQSGYPDLAKSFASGANMTNLQLESTSSTTEISGVNWTAWSGTVTISGVDSKFSQLATEHNGNTFLIYLTAPATTADNDATNVLLPMVQSLSFLK